MPYSDRLPSTAVVDATLAIRVRELNPHSVVTSRLCNMGIGGGVIASHAQYRADEYGTVDLARQVPVSGTYDGVDPMGLLRSRRPVERLTGQRKPIA